MSSVVKNVSGINHFLYLFWIKSLLYSIMCWLPFHSGNSAHDLFCLIRLQDGLAPGGFNFDAKLLALTIIAVLWIVLWFDRNFGWHGIVLWWQAEGEYWCWGPVHCSYLWDGHHGPWPPQCCQADWGNWGLISSWPGKVCTCLYLNGSSVFDVIRMVPWTSLSASATRALTLRLVPWSRYTN